MILLNLCKVVWYKIKGLVHRTNYFFWHFVGWPKNKEDKKKLQLLFFISNLTNLISKP